VTRLGRALGAIAAVLDDLGVRWALVGGLAVSARTEPRTTRDVEERGYARERDLRAALSDLAARRR
jgi:hypothetical protein